MGMSQLNDVTQGAELLFFAHSDSAPFLLAGMTAVGRQSQCDEWLPTSAAVTR
jgi:hypothetical protein